MDQDQLIAILLYTYQEDEIFQYDMETGEPVLDDEGQRIKLLTPEQELEAVKKYYIEEAVNGLETSYRVQLAGVSEERDSKAVSLLVGSWLSKGPAAIQYLMGTANEFDASIIEIEAGAASIFTPDDIETPTELATMIQERFLQYRIIDPYLTGLRRGSTKAILKATSINQVVQVFNLAKTKSQEALTVLMAGGDVRSVLGLR